MADIFISYARADRDRIEKLSKALEAEGWSVWWDRHIESGAEFSKDIERELSDAKAVIVCWSAEGSESRWVKDEANIAAEAGKLLAVTLDADLPPIGFRQYHAVEFSGWKGDASATAFADLTRALRSRIAQSSPDKKLEPQHSIVPPETKGLVTRKFSNPKALAGVFAAFVAVLVIAVIALRGGGDHASDSAVADATTAQTIDRSKSIAVLPFVALSNDDSDEYFGKGIAEELLNALAQFPDLKVAARTSAFSFGGQNTDLRDVGEKLGVAHVLEGSVRRAGDTVRITAQLIRVADGFHLWSETYERELTDVFAIQDEIVEELTRNLQIRLGVGSGTGRASAKSVDPRAYEQYLRGLTLWGDRDNPIVRRDALSAFLRATELEPDFAAAWAMIAMVGARSGADLFNETADVYNTRTQQAFENALRLDPENPITLAALVGWHARHEIDIGSAQRHLDRGLALAPNMADTQYSASLFFSAVGDNQGSIRALERAMVLDPLNTTLQRSRAAELVIAGREDEAFEFFDECAERNCINPMFLSVIALGSALVSGDEDELRARFRTFEETLKVDRQIAVDFEPLRAVTKIVLGEDQSGEAAALLRDAPLQPGWLPFVGPQLANIGAEDKFFNLLFATHRDKALFAQPFSVSHYYPTANQFPERVLRHPRYHEFWALPGMPELAEARRANGQTVGLPLPIGDEDRNEGGDEE